MKPSSHLKEPRIESLAPVRTDLVGLERYFNNTWGLYEQLFGAIADSRLMYEAPDPLRHPLVFYLGHTAAFYVNKLVAAGLLSAGVEPRFEVLFAKGVDPDRPEHLTNPAAWPALEELWQYRDAVRSVVNDCIQQLDAGTVGPDDPAWSVLMGLSHDRIHYETSSVLVRQAPAERLRRPESWRYAPTLGAPPEPETVSCDVGTVVLGRPTDSRLFGWDNEFGRTETAVSAFQATRNLVSNAEFAEFIADGGYQRERLWSPAGGDWRARVDAAHPAFWKRHHGTWSYRRMFDWVDLPQDWPAEVNAFEAEAFCAWRGDGWRLPSEAEQHCIRWGAPLTDGDSVFTRGVYNLNLAFGSPTPVGYLEAGRSASGFNDVYGNVWQWLADDFQPLFGFEPHPLYADFSAPYFGSEHAVLAGGSWATGGTSASRHYRLWFRRHFTQHAGFRLARSA